MPKAEEPIIHYDSPEAAELVTITGWRSRRGFFFGDDERTARYDGCTHRNCEECGALTERHYLICEACRHKKEIARFAALPRGPWDGEQMLYSDALDRYFSEPSDVLEALEELEEPRELDDLRVLLCTPSRPRLIDLDYFTDELPEDGDEHDVPAEVWAAAEAFNKAAQACKPISWYPGKVAWNGETAASEPKTGAA
jgi:hypothetical protein